MDRNPFIPPRPRSTFGLTLAVFLTVLGALVKALALLIMQLDVFISSVAATAETPSMVTRAF